MMLLCIESSSEATVIGLVEGGEVRGEQILEDRDRLAVATAQLLTESGSSFGALSAIAMGIGPGSFTGLRVGLAYAKGLTRALQIPIWPAPSLQVFAANLKGQYDSIVAISPARRGQCHAQRFAGKDLSAATEAQVIEYERLRELLPGNTVLVGPGIRKLEASLAVDLAAYIPRNPEVHRAHTLSLVELAVARWEKDTPPSPGDLVPEYGLEFGI